jgi:polyisoprenoid-binding protein YceI
MRYLSILLLGVVLLVSHTAVAQRFNTASGSVVFLSKAPLNSFEGVSDKLKGLVDLDKNLIDFYLDLNTLDTGIKLRDKHMRDNYLETKKYPFAEFTGQIMAYTSENSPDFSQATPVKVKGTFKLHGVSKELEISGTLQKQADVLVLNASFNVLLSDYKIKKPSLVGYELADEQIVSIKATLQRDKNGQ